MYNRKVAEYAKEAATGPLGRILVFTGARQTGKTTLVKCCFPEYVYLSIEDPVLRERYAALSAGEWRALYPKAALDEVQKVPRLIESVKSVYDQWPEPRYLLLGSSQLLLLEKVRESLAGRCIILEMFPLTLPELRSEDAEGGMVSPVPDSALQTMLRTPDAPPEFLPSFMFEPEYAEKMKAWNYFLRFGGYPALTDPAFTDDDRYTWLDGYVKTYLERDIRDLAAFRDLEPVVKLQRYLANAAGQLLNASAAADVLGVSVKTVQRYLRYFEISGQMLSVPAWSRNAGKRLAKTPKAHYLDNGVLQAVLQKRGGLTGHEFESLVVSEIYKQIRTGRAPGFLHHLRTHDGLEADLLIELPQGYFAFEIKMAEKVRETEASALKRLPALLDKPLLHGFLVSQDTETRRFGDNVTAVHAAYLLG